MSDYITYTNGFSEIELIGAIFLAPEKVLPKIRGIITADDFSNRLSKAVYKAACELADAGEEVNYASVQTKASEDGVEITNDFIMDMMGYAATSANVVQQAEELRKAALKRDAQDVGLALSDGKIDPQTALNLLNKISQGKRLKPFDTYSDAEKFLSFYTDAMEGKIRPFLPTNYPALDKTLGGGLVGSGLIVIAGRPGMGKSTVGMSIAESVSSTGKKVLYVSLEMSREQIWGRRVAAASGVSAVKIMNGSISKDDKVTIDRVEQAVGTLAHRGFYIVATSVDINELEQYIRSSEGFDLVIIDHIGLIRPSNDRESRYESMTHISHRLKQLAILTQIPIIALCQLNRASEAKANKMPSMADLRDTGAIEEDSDVVMLLYRDEYYKDKEEQKRPWEPQPLDVIVDKNRHGSEGKVTFDFTPENYKFVERPGQDRW